MSDPTYRELADAMCAQANKYLDDASQQPNTCDGREEKHRCRLLANECIKTADKYRAWAKEKEVEHLARKAGVKLEAE